ncbi:MAG: branched-chain amino acid transaminase [Eggerthellaceae bacterium]|nr:branched-chain amino acid transaminase [Eggerthellaceae bacterium]
MAMEETKYIWKNGALVPWSEATTHVLSHSLHYGSAVFEGLRCYYNKETDKSYVFRLKEHMDRLVRSAKMCLMDIPYTSDELVEATLTTLRENGLKEGYVRPLVYHGYGQMGVNPQGAPVEVIIACWPWGAYLGEDALANGIKVGVSSWRQRSNNAIPPQMKASASYMNSILAKLEAIEHGYSEAVMLNEQGKVCEGTGENIFVVRDGVLSTPPVSDGLLEGITRDSVLQIAFDLDIPVAEESMVRADLYVADEIFFTGSAAEVTPVGSVDDRVIGKPGPITKAIQDRFFEITAGKVEQYKDWLFEV